MARFEDLTYAPEATIVRNACNTTCETVVKTGRRVADSVNQNVTDARNTTCETVVKTGRRAADYVNSHTSNEAAEIRRHSDDNRDYIVDQLAGRISGWQIFISIIVAALAGVGTWFASKGYILQNVLDANGNVVRQEPFIPYIALLVVLAAIAAFFVAASILSFFERRR